MMSSSSTQFTDCQATAPVRKPFSVRAGARACPPGGHPWLALAAAALLAAACLAAPCLAAAGSPVGLWRSIDDKSGQQRSIIRITEENGELRGTVVRIFERPGDDPALRCKECKGDRKDQPVVGMTILWGMRRAGDAWSGGQILDPESGDIYRCSLTLSEDGTSLTVRGFIGISLFGRSQKWLREE
jgi:uncharacterized protein (DUF2147 family)